MTNWMLTVLLFWLALAVAIPANAVVGKLAVEPRLGEYGTHVYKSIVAIVLIALAGWLFARTAYGSSGIGAGLVCGATWLVLTVGFEFIAGHYAFGNSWERLLADYNLAAGRLWVLVLVATLIAPVLFTWLHAA
ncbi:MAG: hypothetical protein DRI48_07940 [Chloroflexi bacterium]|nr:MAG: hypothetical protein DRI48_07940 [Chloroflexota bacterium]